MFPVVVVVRQAWHAPLYDLYHHEVATYNFSPARDSSYLHIMIDMNKLAMFCVDVQGLGHRDLTREIFSHHANN